MLSGICLNFAKQTRVWKQMESLWRHTVVKKVNIVIFIHNHEKEQHL